VRPLLAKPERFASSVPNSPSPLCNLDLPRVQEIIDRSERGVRHGWMALRAVLSPRCWRARAQAAPRRRARQIGVRDAGAVAPLTCHRREFIVIDGGPRDGLWEAQAEAKGRKAQEKGGRS